MLGRSLDVAAGMSALLAAWALAVAVAAQPARVIDLAGLSPAEDPLRRVYGSSGDGALGVPVAGGLDVNEAKRLKQLEDENRRLKRIVADQQLDITALRDVVSRKW